MRFYFLVIVFVCSAFTISRDSKKNYPKDYFRSPVDTSIRLSGTFGELRPNHLHAGIDIKAREGKVGQPVYSIADGYVARIKVQSGGYGNVLYIKHLNGYTSVYAHLHKFNSEIEKYVRRKQYERKSFEIDLYPDPSEFVFDKGNQIGKLGTSGRSFGPHLHFEIRDSKTEKPINPLLFGFKINDDIAPKLHQLKVYHLNTDKETNKTQVFNLRRSGKNYSITGDTLNIGAWRIGLGLKAYDHHNGVSNWNGVYAMSMYKDDVLTYDFEMETFAFRESRYINAHLDYEEQVSKKSYFNRLYALPGNRLSIYNQQADDGVITLSKGKATKVNMVVEDIDGNKSKLEFWVKRAEVNPGSEEIYNYFLPHNEANIIQNDNLYLHFPQGVLYENLYLKYSASTEKSFGVYSQIHHIHNYKTPVHSYYDIALAPIGLPEELRSKAYIAYCDGKEQVTQSCGGKWKNGKLQAKVRALGDYSILVDTEPPQIQPVSFSRNMRGYNRMKFKITDNIDVTGKARGLRYSGTIDGQWILLEYDAKNDMLTHKFDDRLASGTHTLNVEVWDNQMNKSVFEEEFVR